MKLAVMQPYFFPYIGYFQLIHSVEHFMFFDDVQYIRKSWMSRNRLLNVEKNEPFFIRPELVTPKYQALLPTVKVDSSSKWKKILMDQLKGYKNKAPYYSETTKIVEEILHPEFEFLVDFNIHSIKTLGGFLGMNVKFDRYSDYNFWFDSKPAPGDWGREIAIAVKASHYINSPGGESFIFPEKFENNGMKLGFLQPTIGPYDQCCKNFVPGLSILDVLMFNGKNITCEIVKNYNIKWKN